VIVGPSEPVAKAAAVMTQQELTPKPAFKATSGASMVPQEIAPHRTPGAVTVGRKMAPENPEEERDDALPTHRSVRLFLPRPTGLY
jgi:hypothetical protein